MSFKSAAIPTEYAGVMFRSRLEAKYACFFDLIGWEWEYEPYDLDGYIPDFIMPYGGVDLLVEIKGTLSSQELVGHYRKIVESGWEGPAVIFGANYKTCVVGVDQNIKIAIKECARLPKTESMKEFEEYVSDLHWSLVQASAEIAMPGFIGKCDDMGHHSWTVAAKGIGVHRFNPCRICRKGFGGDDESPPSLFEPTGKGDPDGGETNRLLNDAWVKAMNVTQWKGKDRASKL